MTMDTAHLEQDLDSFGVQRIDTGYRKTDVADMTTAILSGLITGSTMLNNKFF